MNEQELIQKTRKLIGRWDNVRIVGQGWAGDSRRGFQFNPIPISTGDVGGGPSPPNGACCPEDGDCFIATQFICESGGGTYQGDNTTCDPDPCPPPTPTGACCVGTDCTIETEDDCTGMGGTYQGDDTTCDPNPCELPCCNGCGFLHEGIYYLTKMVTISGHCHTGSIPPGDCDFGPISSTVNIDPTDCSVSVICAGTGGNNNCIADSLTWSDHGDGHCWYYLGAVPQTNDPFYPARCWGYSPGFCGGLQLEDYPDDCVGHEDSPPTADVVDWTVTVEYSNPCNEFC